MDNVQEEIVESGTSIGRNSNISGFAILVPSPFIIIGCRISLELDLKSTLRFSTIPSSIFNAEGFSGTFLVSVPMRSAAIAKLLVKYVLAYCALRNPNPLFLASVFPSVVPMHISVASGLSIILVPMISNVLLSISIAS